MPNVIRTSDHEIEAGCTSEGANFHATVMVRTKNARGQVRAVGYVFDESHSTRGDAMKAAEKLALLASLQPDRHLTGADGRFA